MVLALWTGGMLLVLLGVIYTVSFLAPSLWARQHKHYEVGAFIDTQLQRIKNIPTGAVIVIGDSTCLTNLDPATAERKANIPGLRVEALCIFASYFPDGHMEMLHKYLAAEKKPRMIVHLFHNRSLYRLSERGGAIISSPIARPVNNRPSFKTWEDATRPLRNIYAKLFYTPITLSRYGEYYGGMENILEFLRENRGTFITPAPQIYRSAAGDLPVGALEDTLAYDISPLYGPAGDQLNSDLESIGRDRYFAYISPNPRDIENSKTIKNRENFAKAYAIKNGLSREQIFWSKTYYPRSLYADAIHMDERGRQIFSIDFGKDLRIMLQKLESEE